MALIEPMKTESIPAASGPMTSSQKLRLRQTVQDRLLKRIPWRETLGKNIKSPGEKYPVTTPPQAQGKSRMLTDLISNL